MEKVPLFMTKSPDHIDPDASPALAALAAIIHEETTPDDKVEYYKEQGNALYKKATRDELKKAVIMYSEGLSVPDAVNMQLRATMYLNRAAANIQLGNNRAALADTTLAKKTDPANIKTYARAAKACLALGQHTEGIQWCDEGLALDATNKPIQEERVKLVKAQGEAQRKQRMEAKRLREVAAQETRIHAAILNRNIKMKAHPMHEEEEQKAAAEAAASGASASDPSPVASIANDANNKGTAQAVKLFRLENPSGVKPTLNEDGSLCWPVFFLYPEYEQSELVSSFHEQATIGEQMENMFPDDAPPAPWDSNKFYTRHDALEVFFEEQLPANAKSGTIPKLVRVSKSKPLLQVLADPRYVVIGGTPTFVVLSSQSPFRAKYLSRTK
ncbi:hypothetical protein CAOG_02202 [Capsaspora owczarzaki ATCC 30864]|nr:hypothetical protein CAOG_02202 [Capsaspora owczarzaki ATCC 30864]|eukprot:XP_004348952.1 hypothetical protein CAOG_02202 [Capsaspora owczarzaki ATCC 30864]